MGNPENCAFCDRDKLEDRTIRAGELFTSIVSRPWFRQGHCLVVPNRHIVQMGELSPEEGAAIFGELGRLSMKLDTGVGYGMMQKYQPDQPENGIKVSHLHFHVFPRTADETMLFPTPEPNDFSGFIHPPIEETIALAESLR